MADSVRASASIPFFVRPFRMTVSPAVTQGHQEIACADGSVLSNHLIDIFDRDDGDQAR